MQQAVLTLIFFICQGFILQFAEYTLLSLDLEFPFPFLLTFIFCVCKKGDNMISGYSLLESASLLLQFRP